MSQAASEVDLYVEHEGPEDPGRELVPTDVSAELQSRIGFQAWSLQLACDGVRYW
jgi:hypothetical protein